MSCGWKRWWHRRLRRRDMTRLVEAMEPEEAILKLKEGVPKHWTCACARRTAIILERAMVRLEESGL